MRLKFSGSALALLALLVACPAPAQVVINEILANPGSEFDGAEFVELHNKGASPVNIGGWVIGGTEFAGADSCTNGEDLWQFPAGTAIPAGGYVVFAKDNADTVPGDEDDGFAQRFGFDPDFEMFDATFGHDSDDPAVPNMVLLAPDDPDPTHDDQIGLIPGDGEGANCGSFTDVYDVLKLWNGNPRAGATLIDAIEWRDGTRCATDACTGVGTGDNDAFNSLPGVGQSLGRDAVSTDTNDCSADLYLGTTTPGVANIANTGPDLTSLRVGTPAPEAGQPTQITIAASDPDGIALVQLVYSVNNGAPATVTMLYGGANDYVGTIPGQADGAVVKYFVRATDGGNAAGVGVSKYPDFDFRRLRWGTQLISDVQFGSEPEGQVVNVEGIVTAEDGLFNEYTFVIQSAAGARNGIHCFDPNAATNVQRGDQVRMTGTVQEYFGLTELIFFGEETPVRVLSGGNPLPGPDTLNCSQLTTGNPVGEAFEGGYVRLNGVTVTNADLGFGEWQITDSFGSCRVDDDAFYNYTPQLGDSLVAIRGIVSYSFSDRKLEPRDDSDIIGPPLVTTVRYSPLCPQGGNTLTISAQITDDGAITRAMLFYCTVGCTTPAAFDSLPMANVSGTWQAPVGPYPDGTVLDYYIEATDNDGFNGRAPAAGSYDLYVGSVSIQTIQSTFASGTTDSSAAAGEPRNVAGIVTMAPGVLADNIFVIQNHWTTDPAYRGIQVYTGGSVVGLVDRGDSVCVSGDVVEYFGLTQMDTHWTDSFVNYGFADFLPAWSLPTTSLPPDSAGAVPVSEPWEGVLVQMSSSVVTNLSSFGQYYIDNTAPRNGLETLVDDEARFTTLTYLPTLDDSLTVRGVCDFRYGDYVIQPRGDLDILPYDPAVAVGVTTSPGAELQFALQQASPNPVQGGVTTIRFAVPRATNASLRVYDVSGRLVTTLVDGPVEAGAHTVTWNGLNADSREVSSGVYFYRLQAGGKEATRKMILVR